MTQALPRNDVPRSTVDLLVPLYRAAKRYHDYRVVGLEHVPREGPAIIAFTHSLATYDIMLFGATLFFEHQRLIASLADRAIFQTPFLRQLAERLGAVEGEPDVARRILRAGRLLGVAPGGMREALRPSTARYRIAWGRRVGFARLAIETQVPVILAACPAADDCYEVFDTRLTRYVYERFRMPLPVALGSGLLPKRVKLRHLVSEPIAPPSHGDAEAFHAELCARMERLITDALKLV